MGYEVEGRSEAELTIRHTSKFLKIRYAIIAMKRAGLTNVEIAKILHTKPLTIRHWNHIGKRTTSGVYREFYLLLINATKEFTIMRRKMKDDGIIRSVKAEIDAGTLITVEQLRAMGLDL